MKFIVFIALGLLTPILISPEALWSPIRTNSVYNGIISAYALKYPPPPVSVDVPTIQLRTLGARFTPRSSFCSCVSYARTQSPKDLPRPTNARDIKPNLKQPTIGSWVVFKPGGKYSYFGHVGIVIEILPNTIKITEANYIPCEKTERVIPLEDPSIIGYYI